MDLDYRFWHAKEEVKTFLEENAPGEEVDSLEEAGQSRTNLALMSLVTFFTLSKVFQLHTRVGEGGSINDSDHRKTEQGKGKSVSDDEEAIPSFS